MGQGRPEVTTPVIDLTALSFGAQLLVAQLNLASDRTVLLTPQVARFCGAR